MFTSDFTRLPIPKLQIHLSVIQQVGNTFLCDTVNLILCEGKGSKKERKRKKENHVKKKKKNPQSLSQKLSF